MTRYNFAAQRVHQHASHLLQIKSGTVAPAWYDVVGTTPPPSRLIRPTMQRPTKKLKPGRKASRLFQPLKLTYPEDQLRWEYFNDHPWELARPRVVLENDGKDSEKWDWSLPLDHMIERPKSGAVDGQGRQLDKVWDAVTVEQSGRPLNGESVVKRQAWLMENLRLSQNEAYDKARKELYRQRHAKEVEARVAREEALSTGAYFGLGPLEVGMKLEDEAYEAWRTWAVAETQAARLVTNSAYTGEVPDAESATEELPSPDSAIFAADDAGGKPARAGRS